MAAEVSIIDDLGEEIAASYLALRRLPDGRIIGVLRLLFHYTLQVDIDYSGYRERYCYWTKDGAMAALMEWDGENDPKGWHNHPESGRRRNNVTGVEWNDRDDYRPEFNYYGDQPPYTRPPEKVMPRVIPRDEHGGRFRR